MQAGSLAGACSWGSPVPHKIPLCGYFPRPALRERLLWPGRLFMFLGKPIMKPKKTYIAIARWNSSSFWTNIKFFLVSYQHKDFLGSEPKRTLCCYLWSSELLA
jgi:hypothetical protein